MNNLVDKLIIFIFCFVIYIDDAKNLKAVPVLIILILICILTLFENNKTFKVSGLAIYIILSIIYPVYVFFVPLICYEYFLYKINWLCLFLLLPVLINFKQNSIFINVLIITLAAISVLLKMRTEFLNNTINKYRSLRDDSIELALKLEIKNKELSQKQYYEINIATLNERNRIARDIHDNVGHMLSSAILQIGALLATLKDDKIKDNLKSVNNTLSNAMDNIRQSVHNLHDESKDLNIEINKIINNFKFCTAELQYDMQSNPDKHLKYCLIAITKEALANIIKHSNATKVKIILREHPAFYQLIIHDNGTKVLNVKNEGIGLQNISNRVAAYEGNFHIDTENGFKIFISIPKKVNDERLIE